MHWSFKMIKMKSEENDMGKSKMTICKSCGYEIGTKGTVTCPRCGSISKTPFYKRTWFIVIAVIFIIGIIGSSQSHNDADKNVEDKTALIKTTENQEKKEKISVTEVETSGNVQDTTESNTGAPTTEAKSNETVSQKNALRSAKDYLKFTAFSRTGLINQLEFEGFSNEEAAYGVDHCGADWMEQALSSAISYLEYSAFSKSGLINQLEFEGFTNEEATYGVDHCGADWMEQAVKSAKSYLEFSAFSKTGLIDQLQFEGFTYEQAVYGAEENGF